MPIQDDFIERDEFDRVKASQVRMPLTQTDWMFRRSFKLRRCKHTNKIIPPLAKAWYRERFWGLSNNPATELETEWISPAAFTFLKLAGRIG